MKEGILYSYYHTSTNTVYFAEPKEFLPLLVVPSSWPLTPQLFYDLSTLGQLLLPFNLLHQVANLLRHQHCYFDVYS